MYPARHDVQIVGLVYEQVEQGDLQFLAHVNDGVKVNPGRHSLQPIAEQVWQKLAAHTVQTSALFK